MNEVNTIEKQIDDLLESARFQSDSSNFDKAQELANKAVNLAAEWNRIDAEIEAHEYLGYLHEKEQSDLDRARNAYLKCINLLQTLSEPDNNRIAGFYYRIGLTHGQGHPDGLIRNHLMALDILDSSTFSTNNHARIHRDLGLAYKTIYKIDLAEENYLKAVEVSLGTDSDSKNEIDGLDFLNEISQFYVDIRQPSKAGEYKSRYDAAKKESDNLTFDLNDEKINVENISADSHKAEVTHKVGKSNKLVGFGLIALGLYFCFKYSVTENIVSIVAGVGALLAGITRFFSGQIQSRTGDFERIITEFASKAHENPAFVNGKIAFIDKPKNDRDALEKGFKLTRRDDEYNYEGWNIHAAKDVQIELLDYRAVLYIYKGIKRIVLYREEEDNKYSFRIFNAR